MAVHEGARPRTIALPRRPRIAEGPTLDRRRVRAALRAGQRTDRLGLILGQVRVSATGLDIGRLSLERQRLDARADDVRSDLDRLGREPAIRKLAIDDGLGQLVEPIVLPAR